MNHNEWAKEYAATRYLRNVDRDALARRYQKLIQNLWSTDQVGNPHGPRGNAQREFVLHRLHDVLAEQVLSGERPDGDTFDERSMREEAIKVAGYKPPDLNSSISAKTPDGFAKFGKRAHLRKTFESGDIRVNPAQIYYGDSSLNAAQADNELEHYTVTPNKSMKIRLNGIDANGDEVSVEPNTLQLFEYMNVPNFYVWCCGHGCDLRLFTEFQADALLLVHDKQAFTNRLLTAVAKALPDAQSYHGPVSYYDPWTTERGDLKPIFYKKMEYLYQHEYRFAWQPPHGMALAPFNVDLGPLSDVAEYYELK